MTEYQRTLEYLFAQLPMFQRLGASAFKKDLGNTIALCDALGNPQHDFRSIHVAGTNGKGSTSHFLASVLQSAGYRVGLYTSPHLKDFRERIKVNGAMISEEEVIRFTNDNRLHFDRIRPSFFEMTVAMAFHHFREQKVDIAVIETGMGGRLDSTNVITPLLSIITNIGHDHQQFLGETLGEIAGEKAGIIKHRIPVVIGERQDETTLVFINKAQEMAAPIHFASDELTLDATTEQSENYRPIIDLSYSWSDGTTISVTSELSGPHQHKNVRTVICALRALKQSDLTIDETAIQHGIRNVVQQTGLLGRWQCLGEQPLIICDTAHNKEGISPILKQLESISKGKKLHIVWGMVSDKDHAPILQMLPKDTTYYFCRPDIPRGLDAASLLEMAQQFSLSGSAFTSVNEGLQAAKNLAMADDIVFIGGSTFVVAEVV